MRVLRLWLLGTALLAAVLLVWAFAPVLLFLGLLTGALGALSFAIIGLARALQKARGKTRAQDREPV